MAEDASRNPEADSFYYIQLLIESLNKMGQLEVAVESVDHRLPIELFRVVDKTNNEVAQRHPDTIRSGSRRPKEHVGFGLGDKEARRTIISDLLWTLYSKFEAIAEGHRVLHDVIQGIVQRQREPKAAALTGGFKELWKLYQSEVGLSNSVSHAKSLNITLDTIAASRLPCDGREYRRPSTSIAVCGEWRIIPAHPAGQIKGKLLNPSDNVWPELTRTRKCSNSRTSITSRSRCPPNRRISSPF